MCKPQKICPAKFSDKHENENDDKSVTFYKQK